MALEIKEFEVMYMYMCCGIICYLNQNKFPFPGKVTICAHIRNLGLSVIRRGIYKESPRQPSIIRNVSRRRSF